MFRMWRWIDARTGWGGAIHFFLTRKVPDINWLYVLGSTTLLALIIQLVTGLLLMTYYVPAPLAAHESVRYIIEEVVFGRVVRNLHFWGASAAVVLSILHLLHAFFYGAYKYPRELTWIVGVILLLIILAYGFTGYLLPWDQKAYWATVIFTRMAESIPFIGEDLQTLIQGGPDIGSHTLARFYSFHAMILTGLVGVSVVLHLFLVVRHGVSAPPRLMPRAEARLPETPEHYERSYAAAKENGFPFYRYLTHDAVAGLIVVMGLILLAAFANAPLDEPADPAAAGYAPRPDWYFLWLFQALWYFPGAWEFVGIVGVPLVLFGSLFLLPALDRSRGRHPFNRPITTFAGILVMGILVLLTLRGARAPSAVSSEFPRVVEGMPTSAKYGWQVFVNNGCQACHAIGGTGGQVGPALDRAGGRFDRDYLRRWIRNPQAIKPGVAMPAYPHIPDTEMEQLLDLLVRLK